MRMFWFYSVVLGLRQRNHHVAVHVATIRHKKSVFKTERVQARQWFSIFLHALETLAHVRDFVCEIMKLYCTSKRKMET